MGWGDREDKKGEIDLDMGSFLIYNLFASKQNGGTLCIQISQKKKTLFF